MPLPSWVLDDNVFFRCRGRYGWNTLMKSRCCWFCISHAVNQNVLWDISDTHTYIADAIFLMSKK